MLYEDFFGLSDTPFRLTPDPDYYFPSEIHKEALKTLTYSIQAREGFIQITGNPGTGKTLTLRTLHRQLGDHVLPVVVLNPLLTPLELLKTILHEIGASPEETDKKTQEELLRHFRDILVQHSDAGRNVILIIDEAQQIPDETMGMLLLLSNLETEKQKLLQIIVVGQVELETRLKKKEYRQLNQRITIRYRLKPLKQDETSAYIQHRLRVAGGRENAHFSLPVYNEIYKATGGVPRLINIVCERALLAAFVAGENVITKAHLKKGIESISGENGAMASVKTGGGWKKWAIAAVIILGLAWAGFWGANRFGLMADVKPVPAQKQAAVQAKPAAPEPVAAEKQPPAATEAEKPVAKTTQPVALPQPEKPAAPSPMEQPAKSPQPEQPAASPQPEPAKSEPPAPLAGFAKGVTIGTGNRTEPSFIPGQGLKTALLANEAENIMSPPKEAFSVPQGAVFLTYNQEKKQVYIWQGSDPMPVLVQEIPWDYPLDNGLYIMGESINNTTFMLSDDPEFRAPVGFPLALFWPRVAEIVDTTSLTPLVAYVNPSELTPADLEKAREIRTIIRDWADAWRQKDLDKLISYYDDYFTNYLDPETIQVYPRDNLRRLKEDVFIRSGPISVTLSEPMCILDPADHEKAVAIFYQKYVSQIYSDEGIKVKFFHLKDENGQKTWKIVGKFWHPTD